MRSLRVACRIASYRPFEAEAFEHCASLGVRWVEIPLPEPAALARTQSALREHGLAVSTLHGRCDLARPDVAGQVADQVPTCRALDCRILFVSVKAGETPLELVSARLRAVGEVLSAAGISLAIETHPDLAENADVATRTLRGVGHPAIRLNFDTANIAHYNQDADAVVELRRVMPHVASLHLKDGDGLLGSRNFPALGSGSVDFPAVFDELDRAGFDGPCTLEIEGMEHEPRTRERVFRRMAASVEYLRRLGRM